LAFVRKMLRVNANNRLDVESLHVLVVEEDAAAGAFPDRAKADGPRSDECELDAARTTFSLEYIPEEG
jgi:hypothetical protein